MPAVLDRYGTGPRSFGATFWNPGFKTEKTAKKREKTEQKWARYGLRKRVRVADLFLMDRYFAFNELRTDSKNTLTLCFGICCSIAAAVIIALSKYD